MFVCCWPEGEETVRPRLLGPKVFLFWSWEACVQHLKWIVGCEGQGQEWGSLSWGYREGLCNCPQGHDQEGNKAAQHSPTETNYCSRGMNASLTKLSLHSCSAVWTVQHRLASQQRFPDGLFRNGRWFNSSFPTSSFMLLQKNLLWETLNNLYPHYRHLWQICKDSPLSSWLEILSASSNQLERCLITQQLTSAPFCVWAVKVLGQFSCPLL